MCSTTNNRAFWRKMGSLAGPKCVVKPAFKVVPCSQAQGSTLAPWCDPRLLCERRCEEPFHFGCVWRVHCVPKRTKKLLAIVLRGGFVTYFWYRILVVSRLSGTQAWHERVDLLLGELWQPLLKSLFHLATVSHHLGGYRQCLLFRRDACKEWTRLRNVWYRDDYKYQTPPACS